MPQGYRVVSFDLKTLEAKTLQYRNPVDLSIGSVHTSPGGFYLGSDLGFLDYYRGGTDDKDLILTFDYDEVDLLTEVHPNSELKVHKATLAELRFDDADLQQKFGHLLNPAETERRRSISQGVCVKNLEPGYEFTLIRAMSQEVNHLFPMDYAYKTDTRLLPTMVKRVLRAYEEGERSRTQAEHMLRMTLDHAVTTAIYEQAPQHVTCARVPAAEIFRASNEGEYFFDGLKAQAVVTLFEVDEHGNVSIPAPAPTVRHAAEDESPAP
ncbi:hypothetical protein [Pseudomonas serbica]|uniref:hypothetical protein n=1 Tax=Pseudomonas serbica TaxID=2965074 RepID=UPI00237A594A|nr:hypothetical protein [Pseudomonas serbica]